LLYRSENKASKLTVRRCASHTLADREQERSMPSLRAFLVGHPLLVLDLGFRPLLDLAQPYGFVVERTVPPIRRLNEQRRMLSPRLLAELFMQTVQALQQEFPALGDAM
jgi:hypothetical protein